MEARGARKGRGASFSLSLLPAGQTDAERHPSTDRPARDPPLPRAPNPPARPPLQPRPLVPAPRRRAPLRPPHHLRPLVLLPQRDNVPNARHERVLVRQGQAARRRPPRRLVRWRSRPVHAPGGAQSLARAPGVPPRGDVRSLRGRVAREPRLCRHVWTPPGGGGGRRATARGRGRRADARGGRSGPGDEVWGPGAAVWDDGPGREEVGGAVQGLVRCGISLPLFPGVSHRRGDEKSQGN